MKKVRILPGLHNLTLFVFLVMFSVKALGADAPKTTIGTVNNAVSGQPVTIPVTVTGFTNIGSFYFYLEYNYKNLQYVSVTKNSLLTGDFDINDLDIGNNLHRIIMSYSGGITGKTLSDGSAIATFVFNFTSGPVDLKWNTSSDNYCKFTDPLVNKLNDTPKSNFYINGSVSSLAPPAPTIGVITQPTLTVATGSVELLGLPAGNWIINPGAIIGTGSSFTVTGLVPGTYQFTVTNVGNYTSAKSVSFIINPQPSTALGDIPLNTSDVESGLHISGYPNPCRSNVSFKYDLPESGMVTIQLFNPSGQSVALMFNSHQGAGKYSVDCNTECFLSGIYVAIVMLKSDSGVKRNSFRIQIIH